MKTSLCAGVALGALALVGACAHKPRDADATSAADAHKIAVSEAQQRLELKVSADDTTLSLDESAGVESFARLYVRQGHGALILSTPTGGANAEAAALMARDVRMRLASGGVPFAAIAGSTYDASEQGDAPIVLNFTRYSAEAPTCEPLWRQDLAHASDNQPWNSFGCAHAANLAALISDPHDLVEPRAEDPRDAARRARVLEAYRQGQKTHAERTNDERVQISDAVR